MHTEDIKRMIKKKIVDLMFSIDLLIATLSTVLLILINVLLNIFFRRSFFLK